MKTRYVVGLNFERSRFPDAQELFRRIGRPDLAAAPKEEFGYTFIFDREADFVAFRAEASHLGFDKLYVRKDFIYTRSEILAAPLLGLSIGLAPKGFGGPKYGTQFDLSKACRLCGTGALQVGPLILKRSEVPQKGDIFETLDDDTLVSPRVAEAFREDQVTGVELRQVVAHKGGDPLPWYQIITDFELPRMSDLTRGIIRGDPPPCPVCMQDGHYHTVREPMQIVYDATALEIDNVPDIAHTWERFGRSVLREPFKDSHFASPLLIVKPKLFLLFERLKVRRLRFLPVRIVARPE